MDISVHIGIRGDVLRYTCKNNSTEAHQTGVTT